MDERSPFPFLEGFRVLDLTNENGMFLGKLLGDSSADVIKIELPGGDHARKIGPFYHDTINTEKSLFWFAFNLNKRGITLNIETEQGRGIFKRMVRTADFVLESSEPGYLDSIGLGYSNLERINPRIILTSITPFGQTGPYAKWKATDLIGLSMGGLTHFHSERDRVGTRFSQNQFYEMGAIYGYAGTMMAHYHREITGEGQHVDVSCQEAVCNSLMQTSECWDISKVNPAAAGDGFLIARPTPPGPVHVKAVWETKDGYCVIWLFAGGAAAGITQSSTMLTLWGNEEGYMMELKDFDWSTFNMATVMQDEKDAQDKQLQEFLKTKTNRELAERALKDSLFLMPVSRPSEVVNSPQFNARGVWVDL
ncbi:MAG: CoA transferase, partial [Spirochaetota bacterium]|nr:CoA transferase [Spirochaetota bacterium]